MGDGGKGSAPRPFSVAHDEYTRRWDAIFSRDLDESDEKTTRSNEETQQVQTKETK